MRAGNGLRRGQSLWILTKMAMIFFIAALAIILVLFGGIVKGGLCKSSADSTNARIANALNQVINSPLEDERRVIPLETSLAIGESKSSRYKIEIAKRTPNPAAEAGFLIISTRSEIDESCSSGLQVSYPKSFEFKLNPDGSVDSPQERLFLISDRSETLSGTFNKRVTILPSLASDKETSSPRNFRSRFIVVMSCTSKEVARNKYFFIEDCSPERADADSDSCLNFKSPISVAGGGAISSICSFV